MKLLILIAFFINQTLITFGCDCIIQPIKIDIDSSELVFTGKVIKIIESFDTSKYLDKDYYKNKGLRVNVLLLDSFKSNAQAIDTLEFVSSGMNCDVEYELNQSYLFFAKRINSNEYKMIECTHWDILINSQENISSIKRALGK